MPTRNNQRVKVRKNHQRRKIKLNGCKLLIKFGIHNLLFDIRNVFLENRAEERYKNNLIPPPDIIDPDAGGQ